MGVRKRGGSGAVKPETGPTTGIFTDAAVAGIAYVASSGAAGTTDERGSYKYNHGDTVEFKLGSMILGKVKGAPIVTPIELAADNGNRLQNILVLLQSLDMDGNPENGISIPADAAAAVSIPSIWTATSPRSRPQPNCRRRGRRAALPDLSGLWSRRALIFSRKA